MNKLEVKDAHETDKKIPRDLIITYQGKPYATKAALEWKTMYLYGGGNYSVTTDIIERKEGYVLAKAVFETKDGITFSNFGEASMKNVTNPLMQRHLLHLAVTRAECRVLRMVTACAYASAEEMDMGGQKEIPIGEHDNEEPTKAQLDTCAKLGSTKIPATQAEAKVIITELMEKK